MALPSAPAAPGQARVAILSAKWLRCSNPNFRLLNSRVIKLFGPYWVLIGPLLGPYWALLGSIGPLLGPYWALLGPGLTI